MKRFIALVLSLVMALSLCAPAWAEGEVAAETGTVVEVSDPADLTAAINGGATKIILGEGTFTADFYNTTPNRNLTITGQGAGTKLNFANLQVRLELFDSLMIENCTMGRMLGKTWGQLVFGSSTTAGGVYTVSNCIFNGESTQGIYINQNVAATFNIENCVFNGDFGGEGAITIQNNDGVNLTLNVTDCEFNNIPATSHKIYALYAYDGWTLNVSPLVAEVDGVGYPFLEDAVAAGGEVKLLTDVTLNSAINVTEALTIDGNNKTITMDGDKAFFNATGMNEGIYENLTVKNLKMVMSDATQKQGYAVVAQKGADDFAVSFTDCYFENMFCGVMLNGCGGTVAPAVTISGSDFVDVCYGVSFAKEDYAGKVSFENNTMTGETDIQETFTEASGYLTAPTFEITSGTFSVNPTEYVAEGYAATEVEGKYVVAVKKAEIKDEEIKTDVAVVAPEVKVEVDVEEGTVAADVVETLKTTENAIHLDDTALAATAETIEVAVDEEKVADALVDANIPVVAGDEVSVVVQPYYDVQVEDVEVVTDATTGEVASASIQLNITPMYQVVATTADTAAEIDLEGADKNAVVISAAQPIEKPITEKVVIKVAIPEALAIDDGNGGFKPLYVTHDKGENGPKYVYVAKVEGNDVDGYTATFENPNGFSSFTLSTENNTVAVVGDMNYATLQGAIDNAGKGAVIEVMVSGLEADITAPFSFKLKLAEGVDEPTFNVAKGYTMSKWYVNGVHTYIVQSASAGGYAPVAPSTPEKVVTSAKTFDAGIALYVGMSVMAAVGSAVVLKKRED